MKAVGIILAGGNNRRMGLLTKKRAVAAMPVAGSYRAVDFALSNMTNSHIQKVAVLTQYNSRSLHEHLNSSKWWDFGRKHGGLYIFTPTITDRFGDWYRGTADAIYQNLEFLRNCHEPYVIIASADAIYKMDYNDLLDYHIAKRADITVAVRHFAPDEDPSRYGILGMDADNRITDFEEKPMAPRFDLMNMGIYVVRRRRLIELIEKCGEEDAYDFVNDILIRYKNVKKIYGYPVKAYWTNIADTKAYYKANMDFLKPEVRNYFFKSYPEIYSRVSDYPPAKFYSGAILKNALAGGGSIINGTVENAVLFKKVYVGSGAVIKNSIILNNVYIGDNAYIENCIVESHGTIRSGKRYVGEEGIRVVALEDDRYML